MFLDHKNVIIGSHILSMLTQHAGLLSRAGDGSLAVFCPSRVKYTVLVPTFQLNDINYQYDQPHYTICYRFTDVPVARLWTALFLAIRLYFIYYFIYTLYKYFRIT